MRYLLTQTWAPGEYCRWIVEIVGDRQVGFHHLGRGTAPDDWATVALRPSSTWTPNFIDDPEYRLEPLPLTTPRLLSPLDFRPGYYQD